MDWAWWIGTGTLGTAAMTVLGWVIGRGKYRAEIMTLRAQAGTAEATTAEKLTDIAMGLVEPLEKELGRVRGDLETTAGQLEDHIEADLQKQSEQARINEELAAQSRAHAEWDTHATDALAEAGIILPAPPPPLPLHNHQEVNGR